ncbi:MAG TPA: Do family serine endopeptidase [Polyangium sp.]|nr:Do family serine endopeptidase [Polyangium sp.]
MTPTSLSLHKKLPVFGARFVALGLVGSLGLVGCGQPAYVTPVAATNDVAPLNTNQGGPEGGAPVPATFNVADLSEKVKPTVVNITTMHTPAPGSRTTNPFDFFFGPHGPQMPERPMARSALGTGFIISADGYVVTNAHVIEGADKVKVRMVDDREFDADVVGRDAKLDLALLKLKKVDGLPTATIGTSETLRVGEHVLAVGNPFGLGHTVTLGIVSAKARSIDMGLYDNYIQTDASINPGNSGGPLFNWKGEVVGINTLIRAGANGIGFAIPIDTLKDVLPQLRDKGRVDRGKLGLAFQPVTSDLARALGLSAPKGALVSDIAPGGSADRAGIKQGDVIVAVNGTTIVHADELPRNVARNVPKSNIKVSLVRAGKPMDVTASLDLLESDDEDKPPVRRPDPATSTNQDKFGAEFSDMPGGGVRVERVTDPESELERGDIIIEVNGAPVLDARSFEIAMNKLSAGSSALIKVKRGRATRFAAITTPTR